LGGFGHSRLGGLRILLQLQDLHFELLRAMINLSSCWTGGSIGHECAREQSEARRGGREGEGEGEID